MAGATTISNLTNSTSLDGLLKNVYLPTLVSNTYNDTSLTAFIKRDASQMPGGGNQIVSFFLTQWASGVGAISEGGSFVRSVPLKGKQGTENVKFLNNYLELTGPIIQAAERGVKSQVDAVRKSFETNIMATKNNMDRMLAGSGDGVLATVSNVDNIGGSGYVTVTGRGYSASQYLQVGTRVNIITYSAALLITAIVDINSGNTHIGVVTRIDDDLSARTANIYIEDESAGNAIDNGGTDDTSVGDVIISENAYGTITASSTAIADILEINGLQNLISDGVQNSETTDNFKTIWGLDRTSVIQFELKSLLKSIAQELDEEVLLSIILDMTFSRQARPNMLAVSPRSELKYFTNQKDDRRFSTMGPLNLDLGFTKNAITLHNTKLVLTSLAAIPDDLIYIFNTNDLAFASNSPMRWLLGDGNSVLVQSHTGDKKFASAVEYVQFILNSPRHAFKGYSVTT